MVKIVLLSLITIIVIVVAVCVMMIREQSKHYFLCKTCGRKFQPEWTQLLWGIHALNEHKLKCPFCNTKDFCEDVGKV